ncbi:MAG TPA: hypothetical protein VMN36_12470 [Verrucomicrobiales bacterium]|nr:hypothetical protein [Verrucomicrobiales bacterium]
MPVKRATNAEEAAEYGRMLQARGKAALERLGPGTPMTEAEFWAIKPDPAASGAFPVDNFEDEEE